MVQLALREFVLELDQLTEEGALWWKRWASAFTLKVCCAKARSGGDEEGGDLVEEGSDKELRGEVAPPDGASAAKTSRRGRRPSGTPTGWTVARSRRSPS